MMLGVAMVAGGSFLVGFGLGYGRGWGRRKRLCRSLAERVAAQSELLSRRAERAVAG